MDRVTRAKVESLLHEIRSWKQGGTRLTLDELADRFQLDPLMIRRIAESEGVDFDAPGETIEQGVDRTTAVIVLDPELEAAIKEKMEQGE